MPLSVLYVPLVTSHTHGAHESFSSVSLVGRVVWCLSGLDDPAVCFEHRPDAKEVVERLLGFLLGGDVPYGHFLHLQVGDRHRLSHRLSYSVWSLYFFWSSGMILAIIAKRYTSDLVGTGRRWSRLDWAAALREHSLLQAW